MKVRKQKIVVIMLALTLFLAGCGKTGQVDAQIAAVSKDDFVKCLEDTCGLKAGEDFHVNDTTSMDVSYVDEEKNLQMEQKEVPAVVAQFEDGMIAYCTFDTKEEAESCLYAQLSYHMPNPYRTVGNDDSDHKYMYNPGQPGYLVAKLSNVWDGYYYFDNVIIYITSSGKESGNAAKKLLKEFDYPQLSF